MFLLSAPFLASVGNLVFLSDESLPLRFNQMMFAVALGVASLPLNRARLWNVLTRVRPVQLMLLFLVMEICYALLNPNVPALKFIILHQYPLYFGTLLLAFSLIRGKSQLQLVNNAVLITGGLIGVLAIIELATNYNLSHHMCAINFTSCNVSSLHWAPPSLSDGYYAPISPIVMGRYAGFSGDPNLSATVLAMCLLLFYYPFLCNANEKWKQIGSLVLLVLFSYVLVLSQVRSAILAFSIASSFIIGSNRKLLSFTVVSCLVTMLFVLSTAEVQSWLVAFVENRLDFEEIFGADQRSRSLINSLSLLVGSFGIGVGSDVYSVVDNQLNSDDTSPYLTYYVTGGIALGTLHLTMLILFFLDLFNQKKLLVSALHRSILILFSGSIAVALLVNLFYAGPLMFYIVYLYACARSSVFTLKVVDRAK